MADSISINIPPFDALDKVMKAEELAIKQAARQIGKEAEGFAKKGCPVDTGLLRSSITFAIEKEQGETAIYIGSNVEYAVYQENGDYSHKTGGKHFLKNAATQHTDRYKDILEAALNAAKA